MNLEIVRQGYGHAYTKYPFKYIETFRHYERRAREVEKGLWASDEASGDSTSGEATAPAGHQNDGGQDVVYVTKSGGKHHRGNCTHLSRSKIALSLIEAKRNGYGACNTCGRKRDSMSAVKYFLSGMGKEFCASWL